MAVQKIDIDTFIDLSARLPVIDVRSPSEYVHAHFPGAISLPLFTDEERKIVGTTYKQKSRQLAIKAGLDFFGVKMRPMVEEVEEQLRKINKSGLASEDAIIVHCWRGGMRSAGVAWLLDLYGFKVFTLSGGYKAFRQWVLSQFKKEYSFKVLGGYTGSGKTDVLATLKHQHIRVIDLEGLAGHRGSAFGNIGLPHQPSQEQFENKLAIELFKLSSDINETDKSIWVEDESQRIGDVNIPIELWNQMRKSSLYFLDIPFEERLLQVLKIYGDLDKMKMINSIIRIKKRLGGLDAKDAVNAFMEDRTADCFRILLRYYDKWYLKGMESRENLKEKMVRIPCETVETNNAMKLI
jgi:tRNA 2-selenouridine synthase